MPTQIVVSKRGEKHGPYLASEINDLLREGRFSASDLAWYEGAPGWVPLTQIEGIEPDLAAASPEEPASVPGPSAGSASNQEAAPVAPSEEFKEVVGQIAQTRTYASMIELGASSIEQFLATLLKAVDAEGRLRPTREEFLRRFVLQSDRFTVQCAETFAACVRESSFQTEVRSVDQLALARRIRETSFAQLDEVVLRLIVILKETGIELSHVLETLADSPLRDEIHRGAMTGQHPPEGDALTQGKGEPATDLGKPYDAFRRHDLLRRQRELKAQGQALAFAEIVEYLKRLSRLPSALLDYCGTKCFGGDVEFDLQKAAVAKALPSVAEQLAGAIEVILDLAPGERKASPPKKNEAPASRSAADAGQRFPKGTGQQVMGFVALLLGAVALLPVLFVAMSTSPSETAKLLAVGAGFLAVAFFFGGIVCLMVGRAASAMGEPETEAEPERTREQGPVSAPNATKPA